MQWCTWMLGAHVEEWHIPRKTSECNILWIAITDHTATERSTLGSLGNVSWVLHSCTEAMCHSSTHPPNVQVHHCTWSALPGLASTSTASDKCWGEKAWVWGYFWSLANNFNGLRVTGIPSTLSFVVGFGYQHT